MDLVNIIYHCINHYIRSEELLTYLKGLNKFSFSKYEKAEINELLEKVKTIIKNIPIEIERKIISSNNSTLEAYKKN